MQSFLIMLKMFSHGPCPIQKYTRAIFLQDPFQYYPLVLDMQLASSHRFLQPTPSATSHPYMREIRLSLYFMLLATLHEEQNYEAPHSGQYILPFSNTLNIIKFNG
jgi:hypothetical protein